MQRDWGSRMFKGSAAWMGLTAGAVIAGAAGILVYVLNSSEPAATIDPDAASDPLVSTEQQDDQAAAAPETTGDSEAVEETVIDAGALERRFAVQRLPDLLEECRAEFKVVCPVRSEGDTRLYVRVQQIDGHRAWTSPIYLFR